MNDYCVSCKGKGHIKCPNCEGSGKQRFVQSGLPLSYVPCEHCGGSGQKACPSCKGTGTILNLEAIKKKSHYKKKRIPHYTPTSYSNIKKSSSNNSSFLLPEDFN